MEIEHTLIFDAVDGIAVPVLFYLISALEMEHAQQEHLCFHPLAHGQSPRCKGVVQIRESAEKHEETSFDGDFLPNRGRLTGDWGRGALSDIQLAGALGVCTKVSDMETH